MSTPVYQVIQARTAINRVEGMPFRWSLNPYRGCVHDCVYCYARSTHAYLDLSLSDFGRVVVVKSNLPDVLRVEIRRRSWRRETIAIGTATDPYQAAEGQFRITRSCLEVLADARNPCSVTTKGTLVVRDLDVMESLAESTRFTVHLTLVTLDSELARRLEPGAPPPASRLRAMDRLRARGIPVAIFLAPIVPGLTDTPASLSGVVRAAEEHGASAVWPGVLRLAPGVKAWFLEFLDRDFPRLAESYRRGYQHGADAPGWYQQKIDRRIAEALEGLPIGELRREQEGARAFEQLALPLA